MPDDRGERPPAAIQGACPREPLSCAPLLLSGRRRIHHTFRGAEGLGCPARLGSGPRRALHALAGTTEADVRDRARRARGKSVAARVLVTVMDVDTEFPVSRIGLGAASDSQRMPRQQRSPSNGGDGNASALLHRPSWNGQAGAMSASGRSCCCRLAEGIRGRHWRMGDSGRRVTGPVQPDATCHSRQSTN